MKDPFEELKKMDENFILEMNRPHVIDELSELKLFKDCVDGSNAPKPPEPPALSTEEITALLKPLV